MKLSYSATWDDAVALLRTHAPLVGALAGVFLFLPALLVNYVFPQPEVTDPRRYLEVMGGYFAVAWPWMLLARLVQLVGAIAVLELVFGPRGTSVAGAIVTGATLLLFYFAAFFLANILIFFGFILLIVPGLYLTGRLAPLGPVIVAERRRNPVAAIGRSFALTAGRGWAVTGLVLLVVVAAGVAIAVVHALIGILAVLVAGKALGLLVVKIVDAATGAALATMLLLLYAAIYRQLAGDGGARLGTVFE
ncbi:MAG: hypothetical protein JO013_04735 [Alphaproteobacteria bacterium]|nr:hypothetical protein [Alphaproteobacteria bacterium]